MATLFVFDRGGDGINIFSRLFADEAKVFREVNMMLKPGEDAMGLCYEQWAKIADTTGRIDSDLLPPAACGQAL